MRRLLVALVLVAGCRYAKKDQSVCPEYRDMRCVAGVRCSWNRERGCKVCQCEDLDGNEGEPTYDPDDPTAPVQ
jgi:hypothetical protein